MNKKRKIIALVISLVILGALGTGSYFLWYTLLEPEYEPNYGPSEEEIEESYAYMQDWSYSEKCLPLLI